VSAVLLDTGPLVAYLMSRDQRHDWAVAQFSALTEPVLTCEPVWTEAAFLLSKRGMNSETLWAVRRCGVVKFAFNLDADYVSVASLMHRYADAPMSLADACLVRMSELHRDCHVLTLDQRFKQYRRFGRQVIPLISQ
jgi:predicted nucleic acid-binding protein